MIPISRRTPFSLLVATFIGTMDSNALVPIIATYADQLGASLEMVGLIVAMYSIVHIPSNILFGRLVDKIGRKIPFVVGLGWDAFSMLLYAISMNPFHLLLARASHGLGGGLVGPSSMSLAGSIASGPRRGRMMALYGISLALSVLLGFMLSGIVTKWYGYTTLFYALSVSLVIGVGFALTVREPKAVPRLKRSIRQDLSALLALITRRMVAVSYVSIFSIYFILGAITVLLPFQMVGFGMKDIDFGMALSLSAFAVLSIAVHYPSGVLSDKIGAFWPTLIGFGLVILSMILLPLQSTLLTIALTMALFGAGHGFIFPAVSSLLMRETKEEERGTGSGVFYALLVAGVAVGAPLTAFLASVGDIAWGLWTGAIVAVLGVSMVLLLFRKYRLSNRLEENGR